MGSETLFDMREPEDSRKKKSTRRKQDFAFLPRLANETSDPAADRFIARVDGHYECPQCGTSTLDLAEIRLRQGRKKWLVNCSFSCGLSWEVEPVPGVIEEDSKKSDVFRFKHGMSKYPGKTIEEVSKLPGGIEHLRAQAKVAKDATLRAAVQAWLLTHDSCTDKTTVAGQG